MRRPIWNRWVLVLLLALVQAVYLGLAVMLYTRPAGSERISLAWFVLMLAAIPLTTAACAVIIRRGERDHAGRADDLNALVADRSAALLQSRSAVILGLAKLAESRDDQTGRHLERIRAYVRILGERMIDTHPEVDAEFVETIADTSALHDIGKVGIPDEVLLKPGALTDAQFEVIRKHPLIAGDLLLEIKRRWGDDSFLVTACEIAFAHHERYDGTGYPFGLAGEVIPLSARIVAVADVYDALTTERVYKGPLPHEEAREIIVSAAGSHFDPDVVRAFERSEAAFRRVMTSSDDAGSGTGPTSAPAPAARDPRTPGSDRSSDRSGRT